jgi:hypothetical protein
METCKTWSFGGRNQKCVNNFSKETVGYFYLNYERDGRVVLNVRN